MEHYYVTTHYNLTSMTNPFNSYPNFQEPINGGLLIWPPRSYTCSFCSRGFRSAQALGGHMNVHRRDRARLNQSSSSPPQQKHLKGKPLIINSQDGDGDFVETKLSMGLNCGTVMCKRHKKNEVFFHSNITSREDIDLELRLGNLSQA